MKRIFRLPLFFASFILVLAFVRCGNSGGKPSDKDAQKSSKTVANLVAAYSGECNAMTRYAAFAKAADDEGYAGVASLLRAIAKSEEIHSKNFSEVIRKLGGTPVADIAKAEAKTTRENLVVAQKAELNEKDNLYPMYQKDAQTDVFTDAVKAYTFAISSEAEHSSLIQTALEKLESQKESKIEYMVCPICGWTTLGTNTVERCPVCMAARNKFVRVD